MLAPIRVSFVLPQATMLLVAVFPVTAPIPPAALGMVLKPMGVLQAMLLGETALLEVVQRVDARVELDPH